MRWFVTVIRRANTAAHRRPDTPWRVMAALVAFIALWQGFGYAIGGASVTSARGWAPLVALLGNLHVHGVVMLLLGFALAVQVNAAYGQVMLWTLRLLRTYSIVVAACWFGSWINYGVSWGAPGWWVLLAALTTWLSWFPPAHRVGRGAH